MFVSSQVDPFHHLKILPNSDGTITRLRADPLTHPTSDATVPVPVLTQDATINQSNKTFARILLAGRALHNSSKNLLLM